MLILTTMTMHCPWWNNGVASPYGDFSPRFPRGQASLGSSNLSARRSQFVADNKAILTPCFRVHTLRYTLGVTLVVMVGGRCGIAQVMVRWRAFLGLERLQPPQQAETNLTWEGYGTRVWGLCYSIEFPSSNERASRRGSVRL